MPKSQFAKRNKGVSPKRVLGAIVALLVAFILFTSVIGLARKYVAVHRRVRELKEEQSKLVAKQQKLKEINTYIETPAGEEQELRSKYNIIKPGEEVIVLTKPELMQHEEPKTIVGKWWNSILKGLGLRKE